MQAPPLLNSSPTPTVSWSATVRALAGTLAVLVAVLACWWLMGQHSQRPGPMVPRVHVVAGASHYRVPLTQMQALRQYSLDFFEHSAGRYGAALEPHLEGQLDELFQPVEARLPVFLDWYYSLPGEYARIGMALGSMLGLTEVEYVAARASAILFTEAGWDAALVRLQGQLGDHLARQEQVSRASWLAGLMQRLAPYRVPPPLATRATAQAAAPGLSLDSLQRSLRASELLTLNERLALSTGGALAGVTVLRASRAGAVLAARGASHGAARAGGAAAGGAFACAPGGPWALACALAAGTAAWVAVDWALLRAEEALRREEMEASLREGLADLRQRLKLQIMVAVEADIRRDHEQRQAAISREFLPLRGSVPQR